MKVDGVFGDVDLKLRGDRAILGGKGQIGNYLLEKPYIFGVSEGIV